MTTETDPDEQPDLVGLLFYLITALCEDAAGEAVNGQARDVPSDVVVTLAKRLRATGEAVASMADAISTIIEREHGAS